MIIAFIAVAECGKRKSDLFIRMKLLRARIIITVVLAICACSSAIAEIPAGYYNSLNGKKEADLKTAAYKVIRNLTKISSYSALPQYFKETDVYPNTNRWWDMYSDIPLYAPSFQGLNREHSFPKSWWGGTQTVNAYVDLNHLYPSEMAANTAKSNYPLGTVDRSSKVNFDNGVSTVGYPVTGQGGGSQYVYEPADEYKGDFARTYFYMVTCYQDYIWNQRYMFMLQQNEYPTLNTWSVDLLLKWSREDPVSQKEIDRNEKVYGFQNNRNPFIDFPSLAEYIWGNKKGEPFDLANAGIPSEPAGDPNLITPTQGMALDLGQVAIGKTVTSRLFFHGEYLSENLSLKIYSGDKDMFSIPSSEIAAYLVNSGDGYWLNVKYQPSALGKHQSKILISDGGMPGSRSVTLLGECLEEPVLYPCTATDPSDITSDSYVANWTAPETDVIDYFVVTRTIYTGGNATQQQLVAEDNYLLIEDFGASDQESYCVQSSRLGFLSEPSNVVFVNHSGITGVEAEQPLIVTGLEGAIRFICSAPQTNALIYDTTGKLILSIDEIRNNLDINLPAGIYLVTTDQAPSPHKAAVR